MRYCSHCMAKIDDMEEICPKCGHGKKANIPVHHLLPGTILENKFYVGEAIGEGGFGITYIGRDIKLDIKVAIKEFYPNGCVTRNNTSSLQVTNSVTDERKGFFEKGKERFLQEAQVLARFSDEPGIVGVRDYFEENNTAYIIMEYLDGITLKEHLKKQGVLSAEKTVELMMPVMMSLKKVHSQGMIHRDISPDNIMLVGDKVKLLDFGAARNVSASENKSLSIMLKPGYAPEEQYRSKGNQGPWTDVYALCATMYKCITGVTPDDSTQRVYNDEVKTPSALGVKIPRQIENAIMRGMAVQQKDRFQNIDELVKFLNSQTETVGTAPVINRPVVQPPVQPTPVVQRPVQPMPVVQRPIQPTPYVQPMNMVQPQQAPQKKKTGLVVATIIVAILAVVGVVIAILFGTGVFGNNSNSGSDEPSSTKEKTTETTTEGEDTTDENEQTPTPQKNTPHKTIVTDLDVYDENGDYIDTISDVSIDIPKYSPFDDYSIDTYGMTLSTADVQYLESGYYEVFITYYNKSYEVCVELNLVYSDDEYNVNNLYLAGITITEEYEYSGSNNFYEDFVVCDEDMNMLYEEHEYNGVTSTAVTNTGYSCFDDVCYDDEGNMIDADTFVQEMERVLNPYLVEIYAY